MMEILPIIFSCFWIVILEIEGDRTYASGVAVGVNIAIIFINIFRLIF